MKMKKLLAGILATCLIAGIAESQDMKQKAPKLTLITNVKIFDGESETLKDGPVLIENNLIKAIGAGAEAPDGATVIDGGGRTLMPG
ncbi:MAG: amidohydrolase family protein, partial [Gammaproteobacteria bacterium]|nr:amidohydrolase family protein [Gammaproteobacteria bacterium]